MATSKTFFGLRKGSTKSFTYYVKNGSQVTREKAESVKNPRSSSQMEQRCLVSSVMSSYGVLKTICDHSFEGVTYGANSMARYNSVNINARKADPAKFQGYTKYKGSAVPGNFVISEGSLSPSGASIDTENTAIKKIVAATTFGALKTALGIGNGGYITFVFMAGNDNEKAVCEWVRFEILSEADDTAISAENITKMIGTNAMMGSNVQASVAFASGSVTIMAKFVGNTSHVFGACILSDKSDSTWKRSSETLARITEDASGAWQDALDTYPVGASYILNGGNV